MSDNVVTPPSGQTRIDRELDRLRREVDPKPVSTGERLLGILSRTRTMIASGLGDLLDRGEDPATSIRGTIREMEETLVEVRAGAARSIADHKEMQRHARKLERLEADWADKAELALSRGREDLARAALAEKHRTRDLAARLAEEINLLDQAVSACEDDIAQLQDRLREARSRQTTLAARLASADSRVRLRRLLSSERAEAARERFDQLDRAADLAEGQAEALGLGHGRGEPDLAARITSLDDPIEAELDAMKRSRGGDGHGLRAED